MLLIKIPNTKNKIPRSFVVEGDFLRIVQKYMNQRSQKGKTDRFFFQNYQKGKCTAQTIGINKFGNMPKEIATFLGLPDAEYYTGHSFRRTSATLLADSGANLTSLKRLGGWKSDKVAESYIGDSLNNKLETGKKITQSINLRSSPSPSHVAENVRPSTFVDNDNSSDPTPSTSKRHCITNIHEQSYEINNSLSQTVNMQPKTSPVSIKNCTNFNVYVNYNFYKK